MDSRRMTGTYTIMDSGVSFTVKAILEKDSGTVDAGTTSTGLELPTSYCVSDNTLVLSIMGLTGARTGMTFSR